MLTGSLALRIHSKSFLNQLLRLRRVGNIILRSSSWRRMSSVV